MFYTGGPLAGEKEKFPDADNIAKLKRSVDNAEQVGLYIPPSPRYLGDTMDSRDASIPSPKAQRPGGHYIAPAQNRVAIQIIRDLARMHDQYGLGTDLASPISLSSKSSTSPTSEHIFPQLSYTLIEIANYSTVGLYAPREGQAYRERQRRQFSHFDRGTSPAMAELATIPERYGQGLPHNPSGRLSGNNYDTCIAPRQSQSMLRYNAMGTQATARSIDQAYQHLSL